VEERMIKELGGRRRRRRRRRRRLTRRRRRRRSEPVLPSTNYTSSCSYCLFIWYL